MTEDKLWAWAHKYPSHSNCLYEYWPHNMVYMNNRIEKNSNHRIVCEVAGTDRIVHPWNPYHELLRNELEELINYED